MRGLFIGLTTLDLIYQAATPLEANQKQVALDYTMSAGGPATNAAVTFRYLGNEATVLSVLGCHPMAQLLRTELDPWGVAIADLAPDRTEPPPVSSIIVTASTGERAVISINAVKSPATAWPLPTDSWSTVDLVLLDGHQMDVGRMIVQAIEATPIPVVVDGGSWKPGFETVLPYVDYAICSANFYPPDCTTEAEVMAYLGGQGIPHIAITHGENPIHYCDRGQFGILPVPRIHPVDTLGAGDIFHGAFCHYILQTSFVQALEQAAQIAAKSCQFFGPRRWMRGESV